MKKSGFYGMMLLSAAVLLIAGCTEDLLDGRRGEVPIYLTATVSEGNGHAGTRAGVDIQSTQMPSGATFTAEFSDNVTPSSVTYIADGNGGVTTTTQPCFTLSGTSTTVHAYAPSKPAGTTFSVQADQSTDANYRASDLMYATVSIWKLNPVGALTFAHKMAKVIVNATLGDGISSISAVKIVGGYRTINITDATTCTLGSTLSDANSTSGTYITAYSGTHSAGTLNCAAVLPPQTVTNADFLVITTDQGDVTYTLDSKAFATSQSYTFNVTVNAAAIGTTIAITNWADNGSATVNPTVELTNAPANAVAVDLGIKDGNTKILFANMNVGATSITDYGTYFAWGETSGCTVQGASSTIISGVKRYFDLSNYSWYGKKFTKYCRTEWADYDWDSSIPGPDNRRELELGDDAAYANWGGKWRMPTTYDWRNLVNNTDSEWTTINGVKGRKFMKKTDHSVYIFLPAAYSRINNEFGHDRYEGTQGTLGLYWSNELGRFDAYSANILYFNEKKVDFSEYDCWRYCGLPVRAVQYITQ